MSAFPARAGEDAPEKPMFLVEKRVVIGLVEFVERPEAAKALANDGHPGRFAERFSKARINKNQPVTISATQSAGNKNSGDDDGSLLLFTLPATPPFPKSQSRRHVSESDPAG